MNTRTVDYKVWRVEDDGYCTYCHQENEHAPECFHKILHEERNSKRAKNNERSK